MNFSFYKVQKPLCNIINKGYVKRLNPTSSSQITRIENAMNAGTKSFENFCINEIEYDDQEIV